MNRWYIVWKLITCIYQNCTSYALQWLSMIIIASAYRYLHLITFALVFNWYKLIRVCIYKGFYSITRFYDILILNIILCNKNTMIRVCWRNALIPYKIILANIYISQFCLIILRKGGAFMLSTWWFIYHIAVFLSH